MKKKLTDEQIVNAMTDCLGLIHCQKLEIERLTKELDDTVHTNKMYIKKVKQNAKLQKKVDKFKLVVKNMEQGYYPLTQLRETMEEEKSVVVEEFADKLKIKAICLSAIENYHVCNLIDELLKEYENEKEN